MTQKLSYQAKHDALTTLFNRHEFNNRLRDLLQQPREHGTEHALLYLDLDQFKIVNDTCGHDAGDQLLKDVAALLQTTVNEFSMYKKATLARLGGDEFALLLEQCQLQNALLIAHKLCDDVQNLCFFWTDEKNKLNRRVFKISIGLMPTLDLYVIDQTSTWLSNNPTRLQGLNLCSINISAYSLADKNFLKQVKEYLQISPVPLNKICFEVTETPAISNFTGAQRFIQANRIWESGKHR